MKLHFGCGRNRLPGWSNLDLPGTDVTKPLQLSDNLAKFIFHEHLLEHLDEVDGFNFLKECYRVLKPGGILRISCPCIDGLIWVYQNWARIPESPWKRKHGTRNKYINNAIHFQTAWYKGKCFTRKGKPKRLNNPSTFHKFLDDHESLRQKLTKIGFTSIEWVEKGTSRHPELQNLENRRGGQFKHFPQELEMVVEATK